MSGFMKLNLADVGKGFLVAFLTVFVGGLITTLQNGTLPTGAELSAWALSGLAAGLAYLLKNLFTNSNNELGVER